MSLLISSVKANFEFMKDDLGDVGDERFLLWINWVCRGIYRSVMEVNAERFLTTATFTSITSGAQTLPADFKSMAAGGGVYPVDGNGNDTENTLSRTGFGSSRRGYYVNNGTIVFTGINSAETFKIRYIPKLPSFTATTEYLTLNKLVGGIEIIPDEYEEALIADIDRLYSQWDKDNAKENLASFRFTELESSMLWDIAQDTSLNLIRPRYL